MDSDDIKRNYDINGCLSYTSSSSNNINTKVEQNESDIPQVISNNGTSDLEKLFSHANEVKGDLETVINALVGIIGNSRNDDYNKRVELKNLIKETVISNVNNNNNTQLENQSMSNNNNLNAPTVDVENVLKTVRANKLYYEQNHGKSERNISSCSSIKDKLYEHNEYSQMMKESYFRSLLSDPGHLDRRKPSFGKSNSRQKQKNKYTNFDSSMENYFNGDRNIKRSKSVRSSCEMSSDFSQLGVAETLHENECSDASSNISVNNGYNRYNIPNYLTNSNQWRVSKQQQQHQQPSVHNDQYSGSNKSSPRQFQNNNINNNSSTWRMNGNASYHNNSNIRINNNYDPASSGSSSAGGHLIYNAQTHSHNHHNQNNDGSIHNNNYSNHQTNGCFQVRNNSGGNNNNCWSPRADFTSQNGTNNSVMSTSQPPSILSKNNATDSSCSNISNAGYHYQLNQEAHILSTQQNIQIGPTLLNNSHNNFSHQHSLSASNTGTSVEEKTGNTYYNSCFEQQANSISVSDSEGSTEPIRSIPVKKIPKLPSLGTQLPSKQGDYELVLVHQPEQHHRARYMTEGSRGAVKDRTGNGYPTVQLYGWNHSATLQVFVATEDGRVKAHNFYQACKVSGKQILSCKERMFDCTGLIEIQLEPKENQNIVLDCIGILKLRNVDVERRAGIQRIKQKSTMARLVFRVNLPHGDGFFTCLQVVSEPILCTQPIGSPEICKMSLNEGSCKGQMEMFIIGKNIVKSCQVLFQDYSEHKGIIWQSEAKIDVEYLHQTHLVCSVPPYCDVNLKTPITVQVVLNCNGRLSEPRYFTYLPDMPEKSSYEPNTMNHTIITNTDKDWKMQHNNSSSSISSMSYTQDSSLYHIINNNGDNSISQHIPNNYSSDSSATIHSKSFIPNNRYSNMQMDIMTSSNHTYTSTNNTASHIFPDTSTPKQHATTTNIQQHSFLTNEISNNPSVTVNVLNNNQQKMEWSQNTISSNSSDIPSTTTFNNGSFEGYPNSLESNPTSTNDFNNFLNFNPILHNISASSTSLPISSSQNYLTTSDPIKCNANHTANQNQDSKQSSQSVSMDTLTESAEVLTSL